MLIDTRTPDEYKDGHIPGAMNIQPDRIRAAAAKLPRDKSTRSFFTAAASAERSVRPLREQRPGMGHTYLMVFRGGCRMDRKRLPVVSGRKPGSLKH